MKLTAAITAATAFLAAIIGANYLTSTYGLTPVGFGLTATAGTYLAGATFVLRDAVHDTAGRRATLALIAAGCAVSYAIGDGRIALASAVAFGIAELVDLAIYSPLRSRGYVRAAIASNTAGAIVDTFAFLAVAGFPVTGLAVAGQLTGKAWATVAVVAIVVIARRALFR